jgi:hypothetical protein
MHGVCVPSIQDEDKCGDDSSDDGSDVPALIMRHLSASDPSADTTDCRCLAHLCGWNDDSSDSLDTSESCLDDDSEDFDVAVAEH